MRAVRRLALVVAGLGLAWALAVFILGGFDAQILGMKFTTHKPLNPLLVAAAALAIFVLAGGARRLPSQRIGPMGRVDPRWVAAGLAAMTFAVGLAFGTMAVGGSDSYGYVSEADLFLAGNLTVSQPWVQPAPWPSKRWSFAPLGYRPLEREGQWDLAPLYSPGLPLLMAAAKAVGGHCAVFLVVPVLGAVMVLATFGIGRRLGSPGAGVIAAWLVATSPVFLFMLIAPMSDVAVAGVWAAAFYFLLGGTRRSAAAAGLLSALAILIRPNIFFVACVLGSWYLLRAWLDEAAARRQRLWQAAVFAACAIPGIVAIAWLNWSLRGSVLLSSYGDLGGMFDRAHILPNIKNYALWLADTQTPVVFAGFAALVIPLKRLWPRVPDRSIFLVVGLFLVAVWAEYCAFLVFGAWWYLRFLLPCWPFLMLGLASIAVWGLRSGRPVVQLAVAVAVLALGARGLWLAGDRSTFEAWKSDRKYLTVAQLVRRVSDDNSVVLSMQHSGSLRYYGGRMTMRFDTLNDEWLDRAVAWLADHHIHPYALLEDWEVTMMKERFAGQATLAEFDAPPVFVYTGPATIYFYDLWRPVDSNADVHRVVETYRGSRCVPPAPAPTLAFKE